MSERNTDHLDFAAELQDELNKKGLAQVRKALAPETHPDFDGVHCVDCPSKIPKARLAMKKVRCTLCQEALERHRKVYGGRK